MSDAKRINRPEDLAEVHAITRPLLGEVCRQAILTYPSQLQLHWGERVSYKSERLRGEYRGTWMFRRRVVKLGVGLRWPGRWFR